MNRASLLSILAVYAIFGAAAFYLHLSSLSALTNPFTVCTSTACTGPDMGLWFLEAIFVLTVFAGFFRLIKGGVPKNPRNLP